MLEIAKSDILKSLSRDNPWWDDGFTLKADGNKERAYLKSFIQTAANWDVHRSTILMGPRRVGKTVMLHQLIRHLLEDGFPGQSIFFVSIDTPLYAGMPLAKLIELFEEQSPHDPGSKRLIIFDEIQYLKEWEVHLKVLTDQNPATRFVASGSAAAALKLKSQESGAGRFTEFLLPPLTFAEFLHFRDLEKKLIVYDNSDGRTSFRTNDIQVLNEEFVAYLNFGGYPEAVLSQAIQQNVQQFLGRDIVDKVLLRDLPSLYGIQDIQELNRLFTTLAYHTGQEINLEALSKRSGVAKNTITKYLDYLEAAFLIFRIKRVDENGKTFQRTRNFKVYLTNPSMRSALFTEVEDGDKAMGSLAETAILSQWFHSTTLASLYYARWKSGRKDREVDLVHLNPSDMEIFWAVEIKWTDRFIGNETTELSGLFEFARKNGLEQPDVNGRPFISTTTKTVSRTYSEKGLELSLTPTALLCYSIGKHLTHNQSALGVNQVVNPA